MRSRIIALFVVAGLALGAASCGKDKPARALPQDEPSVAGNTFTGLDTFSAAINVGGDMIMMRSAHVTGQFKSVGDGEVAIDLDVNHEGDCSGTVTTREGTREILAIGSRGYLRGNKEFYRSVAGANANDLIEAVADKWISATRSTLDPSELCTSPLGYTWAFRSSTPQSKGELSVVNGVPAMELTGRKDGVTAHAWVAIDAPHYIVKIVTVGGYRPGIVNFSHFDKHLEFKAPPADQIAHLGP